MIVLVCGGRDYRDVTFLEKVLDKIHTNDGIEKIIHGGARGADALAGGWASRSGIKCKVYQADWVTFGNAAGPMRNQFMLDDSRPDLVVAFPGGKGTADMVSRARRAGVKLITIV